MRTGLPVEDQTPSFRRLWIFKESLMIVGSRPTSLPRPQTQVPTYFVSLPPPPVPFGPDTGYSDHTTPHVFTSSSTYQCPLCPEPFYNLSCAWNVHLVRSLVPADLSSAVPSPEPSWTFPPRPAPL